MSLFFALSTLVMTGFAVGSCTALVRKMVFNWAVVSFSPSSLFAFSFCDRKRL
ncbi:membrane protein [gut metagenome]|uniref:Membrane protein n=1 Tax=gut metagenome TaxID=749906 RepID=J9FVM1_9ZZZZ